jgi:2Fe-2S ferredoxin
MVKIVFVEFNGARRDVDVKSGLSLMESAVRHNVSGIVAECGGACACATCHVYVEPDWLARTGPRTEVEESMLDYADGVRPNSRLSCQIKVTEDLDGLVVALPQRQG